MHNDQIRWVTKVVVYCCTLLLIIMYTFTIVDAVEHTESSSEFSFLSPHKNGETNTKFDIQ